MQYENVNSASVSGNMADGGDNPKQILQAPRTAVYSVVSFYFHMNTVLLLRQMKEYLQSTNLWICFDFGNK